MAADQSPAQTAQAALASVVRLNTNAPLIVNLVASNQKDYDRLADALSRAQNARVVQAGEAPLATVAQQDDPRQGVRQQQAIQVPANSANTTNGGNYANNSVYPNNGNFLNGNAESRANNPAVLDSQLAKDANVNFDLNRNQNAGGQSNGNSIITNSTLVGGNGTLNLNQNVVQLNNNGIVRNNQNPAQGAPYHVALRADQLRQLVTDFHANLIARGEVTHVLGSGEQKPALAEAAAQRDLLNKIGIEQQQANPQEREQAGRQQLQNAANDASQIIDCVITMDPPPNAQ